MALALTFNLNSKLSIAQFDADWQKSKVSGMGEMGLNHLKKKKKETQHQILGFQITSLTQHF